MCAAIGHATGPADQFMTTIVWFRQDLRTADNPGLAHAAAQGDVLPVYVLDETPPPDGRPLGAASRWWLHQSLAQLSAALGGLVVARGEWEGAVRSRAENPGNRHRLESLL